MGLQAGGRGGLPVTGPAGPEVQLVLASGSPRRADLLRDAGIDFVAVPPLEPEPRYNGGPPDAYALWVAELKAAEVASRMPGRTVLAADTIVVWRGQVFAKPSSREEARSMLERLSNDTHQVVTAVALREDGRMASAVDRTSLRLRALTSDEIERYLDTGEPMDKAGAYALQGRAARFVTRVDGDRETVIGLPTRIVRQLVAQVRAG